LSAKEKTDLENELFRPPYTEAELMEHARHIISDGPRVRNATINRWGEQARRRYGHVLRRARGE
jgi:hypothetical protein